MIINSNTVDDFKDAIRYVKKSSGNTGLAITALLILAVILEKKHGVYGISEVRNCDVVVALLAFVFLISVSIFHWCLDIASQFHDTDSLAHHVFAYATYLALPAILLLPTLVLVHDRILYALVLTLLASSLAYVSVGVFLRTWWNDDNGR